MLGNDVCRESLGVRRCAAFRKQIPKIVFQCFHFEKVFLEATEDPFKHFWHSCKRERMKYIEVFESYVEIAYSNRIVQFKLKYSTFEALYHFRNELFYSQ